MTHDIAMFGQIDGSVRPSCSCGWTGASHPTADAASIAFAYHLAAVTAKESA